MMTAGAVSGAGGVAYYTSAVGGGMENYYLGAVTGGEAPGQWRGGMAASLGLTGEVKAEDMHQLYLSNVGPNGEQIAPTPRGYEGAAEKIAAWIEENPHALPEEIEAHRFEFEAASREATHAWDLTVNLPKSVSVAWAAARREELNAERAGDEAGAARHRADAEAIEGVGWEAVNAILGEVEGGGLQTRAGWHGGPNGTARYVPGEAMTAAVFFQRDNREGEMHLHWHMVVHNYVKDAEGAVRAIDGTDLLARRREFSTKVDMFVADGLERIGLHQEYRGPDRQDARGAKNAAAGSFEIAEDIVSREMVEAFSSRRRAITGKVSGMVDAYRERNGREPNAAELHHMHQWANKATRKAKSHEGISDAARLDKWQEQLQNRLATGLGPVAARMRVLMGRAERKGHGQEPAKFSPHQVKATALASVAEKYATWTRANLMEEIKPHLMADATMTPAARSAQLDRLTDEALGEALQVSGLPLEDVATEQDAKLSRAATVHYATPGTLAAEEALRQASITRGGHSLDPRALGSWIAENAKSIGADQLRVLVDMATTDARLSVLEGPPGTGKSYVVGRFSEAWAELSGGGRVHGLAVGQIAAQVMAREGVETTANTSVWLGAQDRMAAGKAARTDTGLRLLARDVVLVDEASMVGTDQLTRIMEHADRAGARVVLVGDQRQLAAVDAGGALGLLEGHAENFRLWEVRRFHEEWEGPASLDLRDGKLSALIEYDRRGRLEATETAEEAQEKAARGVAADRLAGKTSIAVVRSNEEAAAVASISRAILVEAGLVEEDGLDLRDGGIAGVGDLVMMRRNDYRQEVINREVAEVREVRADGGLSVVMVESGEFRSLSAKYVGEEVTSALAGTAHAVEGVTVDRSYSLLDGSEDRAAVLVPLTRGREHNVAFVVCAKDEAGNQPSPVSVLAPAIQKDTREVAATVMLEQDAARRSHMAFLADRYEGVARAGLVDRTNRHLDRLAEAGVISAAERARLGTDKGIEHLSRQLRTFEEAGRDPFELLASAAAGKLPTEAKTREGLAQVLSYRISQAHGAQPPAPVVGGVKPSDLDQATAERLEFLDARMGDRRSALGAETAKAAPAWAVRLLGEVPEAGTEERAAWEEAAGKAAGIREARSWEDEERALPGAPSPYATERWAAWHEAYDALGRPAEEREEASMTEGRLRARVAAMTRAAKWAPASANDSLRTAEQAARNARQEAALEPDEIKRKEHEADAEYHASLAELFAEAAAVRDEYLDTNRATLDNGRRALEALKDRELPTTVEDADDATTYEEWMQAEQEARTEDDQHRTITEADLVQEEQAPEASWRAEEIEAAPVEVETPETPYVLPVTDRSYRWAETQQAHFGRYIAEATARLDNQASQEEAAVEVEPDEWEALDVASVEDEGDVAEIGGLGY